MVGFREVCKHDVRDAVSRIPCKLNKYCGGGGPSAVAGSANDKVTVNEVPLPYDLSFSTEGDS